MRKKNFFKRVLAFILVCTLIVTCTPNFVYAGIKAHEKFGKAKDAEAIGEKGEFKRAFGKVNVGSSSSPEYLNNGNWFGWYVCDKRRTSSITWFTAGYAMTKDPISSDHVIPRDAFKVWLGRVTNQSGIPKSSDYFVSKKLSDAKKVIDDHASNLPKLEKDPIGVKRTATEKHVEHGTPYTDTIHAFTRDRVTEWMDAIGVKADDEGWRIMYFHTIAGVDHSGVWQGKIYQDQGSWRKAEAWGSTTKNESIPKHYNQKIKIKTDAVVKVHFRTYQGGISGNGRDTYDEDTDLKEAGILTSERVNEFHSGMKIAYDDDLFKEGRHFTENDPDIFEDDVIVKKNVAYDIRPPMIIDSKTEGATSFFTDSKTKNQHKVFTLVGMEILPGTAEMENEAEQEWIGTETDGTGVDTIKMKDNKVMVNKKYPSDLSIIREAETDTAKEVHINSFYFDTRTGTNDLYDKIIYAKGGQKRTAKLYNQHTITYYYAEISQLESRINVEKVYHDGSNVDDAIDTPQSAAIAVKLKDSESKIQKGDSFTLNLNEKTKAPAESTIPRYEDAANSAYDMQNAVWQLTKTEVVMNASGATVDIVDKDGKTLLDADGKKLSLSDAGTIEYLYTAPDTKYSKWKKSVESANRVRIEGSSTDTGTYTQITIREHYYLYPPAVALSYYMNGNGKTDVFKAQLVNAKDKGATGGGKRTFTNYYSYKGKNYTGTPIITGKADVKALHFESSDYKAPRAAWGSKRSTQIIYDRGDPEAKTARKENMDADTATKDIIADLIKDQGTYLVNYNVYDAETKNKEAVKGYLNKALKNNIFKAGIKKLRIKAAKLNKVFGDKKLKALFKPSAVNYVKDGVVKRSGTVKLTNSFQKSARFGVAVYASDAIVDVVNVIALENEVELADGTVKNVINYRVIPIGSGGINSKLYPFNKIKQNNGGKAYLPLNKVWNQDGLNLDTSKLNAETVVKDSSGQQHKVKFQGIKIVKVNKHTANDYGGFLKPELFDDTVTQAETDLLTKYCRNPVGITQDNLEKMQFRFGANYRACLIKVFRVTNGYWKTSYVDVEDGPTSADVENPNFRLNEKKKTYKVVSTIEKERAQYTQYSSRAAAINSFKNTNAFKDSVAHYKGKNNDEWGDLVELTNVGITLQPGNTDKKMDYSRLKEVIQNLETWSGYKWLIDTSKRWSDYRSADYLEDDGTLGDTATSELVEKVRNDTNYFSMKSGNNDTTLVGVYKPRKTIHVAQVYKSSTGKILSVGTAGYDDRDLNIYTVVTRVYSEPYITINNEIYKLKHYYVTESGWQGNSGFDFVDQDAITIHLEGVNKDGGKDYGFKKTAYENLFGAGSEYLAPRTPQITVNGERTYVLEYYEKIKTPPSRYKYTTKEKIEIFRQTEAFIKADGSWYENVLYNKLLADGEGTIKNDTKYSTDPNYDVTKAIPSSEFVTANGTVPKYLGDISYKLTDYYDDYEIGHRSAFQVSAVFTDSLDNEYTVYFGKQSEDSEGSNHVEIVNSNAAVQDYSIYTVNDITIKNAVMNNIGTNDANNFLARVMGVDQNADGTVKSLAERISETNQVTLFKARAIFGMDGTEELKPYVVVDGMSYIRRKAVPDSLLGQALAAGKTEAEFEGIYDKIYEYDAEFAEDFLDNDGSRIQAGAMSEAYLNKFKDRIEELHQEWLADTTRFESDFNFVPTVDVSNQKVYFYDAKGKVIYDGQPGTSSISM